jgi:hypothetical protein
MMSIVTVLVKTPNVLVQARAVHLLNRLGSVPASKDITGGQLALAIQDANEHVWLLTTIVGGGVLRHIDVAWTRRVYRVFFDATAGDGMVSVYVPMEIRVRPAPWNPPPGLAAPNGDLLVQHHVRSLEEEEPIYNALSEPEPIYNVTGNESPYAPFPPGVRNRKR